MTSPTTHLDDDLLALARRHALLTVKDAAEVLGLTPWWVRRLIATGELRGINVGGAERSARWRLDPLDVQALMLRRQNRPRDLFA